MSLCLFMMCVLCTCGMCLFVHVLYSCVCTCVCVFMCVYECACAHVYLCVRVYVCICVHMNVYLHVWLQTAHGSMLLAGGWQCHVCCSWQRQNVLVCVDKQQFVEKRGWSWNSRLGRHREEMRGRRRKAPHPADFIVPRAVVGGEGSNHLSLSAA